MKKTSLLLFLILSFLDLCAQEETKDHSRAETLLYQAIAAEKNGADLDQMATIYERIVQIDPEYPNIYYAWAISIHNRAKKENDDALYSQSFEKIKNAIETDSTYVNAYCLWGMLLAEYAEQKKDDDLYREALTKFTSVRTIS